MAVVLTARSPARVSASACRFWWLRFLLLVLCAGSGNTVSPFVVNGVLGESVILPLKLPADKKMNTIIWSYGDTAFILLNLSKRESPQYVSIDKRWTDRLNFTESFSMRLSNLTMADTGLYKVQIDSQIVSNYTLRIFRPLSGLQVTKHIQLSANGTCEIQLACSVEDPDDAVSFRWQAPGELSLSEPNLTISWDPRNSSEQDYTCVAGNPVSNLSSSVSAQALCKGVLTQGNPQRHNAWIIVGVLSIIAFFCFMGIFILCKRRQGSFLLSARQTQHPAGSSQDMECTSVSPGSTVYAQVSHPRQEMEIPTPTKNDSVTIYSTVNHSKERKPISPRPTALHNIK